MKNQNQSITLSVVVRDDNQAIAINTDSKTSIMTFVKNLWKSVPKTLATILIFEVIAVYGLLFFVAPSSAGIATAVQGQEEINADILIARTNTERAAYNLPALKLNPELSKAATAKAHYILQHDSFNHEGTNGETFSTWVRETDYAYTRVGENLAIHFNNPDRVIAAWLDSPLHRKNLLNPYFEDIGMAVVTGEYEGEETTIVVQLFGTQVQ